MNNKNYTEVIIIGAGQAGLAVSYLLTQEKIDHLVFEKTVIGSSWKSQRWDSFKLNTPNWMNFLPGQSSTRHTDREAFINHIEFASQLKNYAETHHLPIVENTEIRSLSHDPQLKLYRLETLCDSKEIIWYTKQVVVATGSQNQTQTPSFANKLPTHIQQLHAADYKNPLQLPKKTILIVGSGQTGCQIAEELSATHKVYLATGKVGRSPRRYRGLDMMDWMNQTGMMDQTTSELKATKSPEPTQPQVSGVGPYGHTISLQSLRQKGVTLLGRFIDTDNEQLYFDDSLQSNIRYADQFSELLKKKVDIYIQDKAIIANIDNYADSADIADTTTTASLAEQVATTEIDTIIWSTGFRSDFQWIQLPILDHNAIPIHTNGVTALSSVYFIGLPWLRKKKSGIIFGIMEDAEFIVQQIVVSRNS